MSYDFGAMALFSSKIPLEKILVNHYNVATLVVKAAKMVNHILIRRIALSLASVSFGALFAVILGVSASRVEEGFISVCQEKSDNIVDESLAHQITGTDLTIEQIAVFDGPFYEDGTGREVMNTMAVLVKNRSNKMILHSWFEIETECGKYSFEATMIPPFSSVLIPEKRAQQFVSGNIINCEGWEVKASEMEVRPLALSNTNKMSIRIDNLSMSGSSNVKIYYKTYLADEDIYVGGIAHFTTIDYIPPLDRIEVSPSNYCSDYSKIVYVQ